MFFISPLQTFRSKYSTEPTQLKCDWFDDAFSYKTRTHHVKPVHFEIILNLVKTTWRYLTVMPLSTTGSNVSLHPLTIPFSNRLPLRRWLYGIDQRNMVNMKMALSQTMVINKILENNIYNSILFHNTILRGKEYRASRFNRPETDQTHCVREDWYSRPHETVMQYNMFSQISISTRIKTYQTHLHFESPLEGHIIYLYTYNECKGLRSCFTHNTICVWMCVRSGTLQ